MKIQITILIVVGVVHSLSAQIGNDKAVIVKNKVKESFEKHCFTGRNSSCTVIWEKYDRRGNPTEWVMGRLGFIGRTVYDEEDRKIFTLTVDKMDTTKVDTIAYAYDSHQQLIRDGDDTFKNAYNGKEQLVRQVCERENREGNIVRQTKSIRWTGFGKVKAERTKTEVINSAKPTKYEKFKTHRKAYEYDRLQRLTKEVHYLDDTVTNTICYSYDENDRLTEKREKDLSRLESINSWGKRRRAAIEELVTRITYHPNGTIKEKYTYFSDPCMGLNNHYLYKHYYLDNGLLEYADVYEEDQLVFSITYEYQYFE